MQLSQPYNVTKEYAIKVSKTASSSNKNSQGILSPLLLFVSHACVFINNRVL
jgi:hypothetical protein